MTHEDRLYDLLAQHAEDQYPGWGLYREQFGDTGHRLMAPVEPCDRCGHRVWLMLPAGWQKPVWVRFGDLQGGDTLFPQVTTKRHECGDGDSWSVEAAAFVESALREWAS